MAYDGSIKIDTKIDTSGFKAGVDKLKGIAKTGCSAITTSLTTVVVGITAVATASVKVGADFEAAMSRVSAISGATGDELQKLKDQAIQLGADTAFSAKEAAQGMENLASAGFTTAEIMNAMPGMLDLAASSGEDLASSADIAASTLRGFGLDASKASHVADVLAKNAADTNAAVADTGEAMKYIAPLAKAAGISFEETAAAIGIMADNGIKGGQAGTTLRGALSRLSKPTDAMYSVMEKLNISFYDSEGKMKSLSEQSKMLKEATADLSDEERNNAIVTLYGQEALSGMLALMNSEEGRLEELTKSYESCDGAAAAMAETMQDNLKSKVEELGGSLETLGIRIYDEMQEPLKDAANEAIEYVNKLTNAFTDGGLEGLIEEAGNIFGELATKAAEAAPEMVNAAIGFIESFVEGIADNADKLSSAAVDIIETIINGVVNSAPKLIEAAKTIVSELVNNLVKLLPNELQKPVKEAVDTIKKSFENGGLKKAINTVKTIIENLGKQVTKLAKIILPPLAKAIDFVANNINILLPLATGLYAAYKTWSIISTVTALLKANTAAVTAESLAHAASTGAITIKQIAVGVLTGQIGLATAAQYAWNLAMSLNPIGLVITAVAGLAVGLGALCLTQDQGTASTDRLAESETKLQEANEELSGSYETIGGKLSDFYDGISSAKNILDDFDDSILLSNEKQQELSDAMSSTQEEITTIASTATENRRQLTQSEIDRLDELFAKMKELTAQELAIEEAKQEVVTSRAQALKDTHAGTLSEYEEHSQALIKTAEDTRASVIDKADSQYTEQLALYKQLIGTSDEYNQEWYDKQVKAAENEYQLAIDNANKTAADTINILQQGYLERADALNKGTDNLKEYQKMEQTEAKIHSDAMQRIQSDYDKKMKELLDSNISDIEKTNNANTLLYEKEQAEKEENARYNEEIAMLRNNQQKILDDENYQNQLSSFLGLMGLYETYSGETNKKSQDIVKSFITPFKNLPEESKTVFSDALAGAIEGLESKEFTLFNKASSIANGVVNMFKTIFDEHSPSKVFNKIFKYTLEGGEDGLDEEAPKLYRSGEKIGDTFTKKFKNRINTEGLINKMRNAVYAGTANVATTLTSKVIHSVNIGNNEDKKFVLKGNVVTHIDVDGRECAVLLTPYISEELSFAGG